MPNADEWIALAAQRATVITPRGVGRLIAWPDPLRPTRRNRVRSSGTKARVAIGNTVHSIPTDKVHLPE